MKNSKNDELRLQAELLKNEIMFSADVKIYPLEIILNTAYNFLDKAYVFLGEDKNEIKISIKPKDAKTTEQLDRLVGEFKNEMLNQTLRFNIVKNNKKIHEYIIGQALFSANPRDVIDDKKDDVITEDELDKMLERELKALEESEKREG